METGDFKFEIIKGTVYYGFPVYCFDAVRPAQIFEDIVNLCHRLYSFFNLLYLAMPAACSLIIRENVEKDKPIEYFLEQDKQRKYEAGGR